LKVTSSEEKQAVCPTRLVSDQVATEDAFQHKAIALAIADVILHEEGGGAIALTGAWGSGKSTVVKFLKGELKDASPSTETFIFDAWAHQGDPLRRTFLEKLIRWCNDQNPRWTKDTQKWETRIEELAKRREITNSKMSPNLTIVGAIGAISLLLVPAATQMYLKNTYAAHRLWDFAGLTLSVLPAAVAALVFVWWTATESWRQQEKRKSIPSFISAGTTNDTTSETNKTADPTSVEFEKNYCELLTEAMAGNDRRIVIVVDNLDRITHDDARSIWATLRVFFDRSVDQSADWEKRVWVLEAVINFIPLFTFG
jgi:energy-coupling factor transporter ATP-binding protein EcfA2